MFLASHARKEMLDKWKREKELKKKLEAQEKAKKKPFKVCHLEPSSMPFSWVIFFLSSFKKQN